MILWIFSKSFPANLVTRILNAVDSSKRNSINLLLNYPEDSAGSIMTTEYVSLHQSMTVKEAMAHIKQVGIHKETIYTCYVLERRKLIGIVSAKDLMTMNDDTVISESWRPRLFPLPLTQTRRKLPNCFQIWTACNSDP